MERNHASLIDFDFECDPVAIDLARLDTHLMVLGGANGSGDGIAALLEDHKGGRSLSLAIGAGDVESTGPFAGDVGKHGDGREQKTAQNSGHVIDTSAASGWFLELLVFEVTVTSLFAASRDVVWVRFAKCTICVSES